MRFPANNSNMYCVELAPKGVLYTRLGSKGQSDHIGLLVLSLPDGDAILMRPNKAETGRHCPVDMCACVRYWPDRRLVFE